MRVVENITILRANNSNTDKNLRKRVPVASGGDAEAGVGEVVITSSVSSELAAGFLVMR